jgi:hypothetical protein
MLLLLLLLLLTANGFSPGGSGTTIRQQTNAVVLPQVDSDTHTGRNFLCEPQNYVMPAENIGLQRTRDRSSSFPLITNDRKLFLTNASRSRDATVIHCLYGCVNVYVSFQLHDDVLGSINRFLCVWTLMDDAVKVCFFLVPLKHDHALLRLILTSLM